MIKFQTSSFPKPPPDPWDPPKTSPFSWGPWQGEKNAVMEKNDGGETNASHLSKGTQ